MKKIFIVIALILMLPLTVGVAGIAYAEEPVLDDVYQNEIVEELHQEDVEIEETEKLTAKITEYVIAGVLGLFGTSAAAILFRGCLKGLVESIKSLLHKVKEDKTVAEEEVKALKEEVLNAITSLEGVKQELVNSNNKEFNKVQREIQMLKNIIFALATGTKELVVNGTAESISNIVKTAEKEVVKNGE